jgi:hypothetical protein
MIHAIQWQGACLAFALFSSYDRTSSSSVRAINKANICDELRVLVSKNGVHKFPGD